MGACIFNNLVPVKGDARNAYNEACREMRDYNGYQEGYSGDIQTTDGFRMSFGNPKYGTKAFYEWEQRMIDQMNKRECLCIEIKSPTDVKKIKEHYGLKGKKGIRVFYFFGWGAC